MEVREILGEFGYDADNTPIIIGSALNALEVRLKQLIARIIILSFLICSEVTHYTCSRPNPLIPQCTCPISHNAPFRTEMHTFLF